MPDLVLRQIADDKQRQHKTKRKADDLCDQQPSALLTERLFFIGLFFHYSLFTVHRSLFTIHCSLFIFRFSLFTIRFSLFTFHYSLFTASTLLFSCCLLPLPTAYRFTPLLTAAAYCRCLMPLPNAAAYCLPIHGARVYRTSPVSNAERSAPIEL